MEGAGRLLSSEPKHLWIMEISITNHRNDGVNPKLKSIFQKFWDQGYQAWVIGHSCEAIDEEMIDQVVRDQAHTFPSNNFLFLPEGATL